jgi:hypothetical protein
MSFRGSVDVVTTKGASGWVYAQGRPDGIAVQAVLSHEVIGDAAATDHRPDLVAAGLGKGNCGYAITFYREIDPLYLPFVSVKVDGGDAELPRASQLGFVEFFAAFHRNHPSAGRSRSVLGGLWIDRTDAAAMLKSKVEIGQFDAGVAAIVGQLIHQGIAIIEQPAAVEARKSNGAALSADRVAALVEEAQTFAALRAILDDNPLVQNAEIVSGNTDLVQPSAESGSPSPAECLVIAAPVADREIAVEVVRDSHRLPEFTPGGISRWASSERQAGVEVAAAQQGLLTRYDVPPGSVAIVGPGTIYRLCCAEGADGIKLQCAPSRAMPIALAKDTKRRETARKTGVRVWI